MSGFVLRGANGVVPREFRALVPVGREFFLGRERNPDQSRFSGNGQPLKTEQNQPALQNRKLWIWLALGGMMGAVLLLGLSQHPSSFDDAYITYRYARNIALGRGFVYNIGERVLGTTTPLYALLLAGLSLIWSDIPALSHYIGVITWMLCVPVIYGIGREGSRAGAGLVAGAFVAFNPLIVRVVGMETSLYVLFVLLAFFLYLKEQPLWTALCASLAFLTRWDGILVIGVLIFAELPKARKAALKMSVVCAAIIVPWLVYSYVNFGSIFPNTFYAKLGQGRNEGLGGAGLGTFEQGLLLIAESAYAEKRLFILLPLLWIVGLYSVVTRRFKWWPILLWTASYTCGYIALGVLRFSWYYPPLVPSLALLAAGGIDTAVQFVAQRLNLKVGRYAFLAVLCVLCLIPHIEWSIESRRTQMDVHSASYVKVGNWLQVHTPPDSSVALLEIGIIGFYSDRTVVDTMGLVSPGMLGHLGDWIQTLQFAVNHYWPDYVVALQRTAWEYLVNEPWFKEAYTLETKIENTDDPVAPISIYRRRSGFPVSEFVWDVSPHLEIDQAFALRRLQVAEKQLNPGEMLHVQLTWAALANINDDYRFQFDLVNITDGQRWTLASGLQPMRGGNPTNQWRNEDQVVDGHLLQIPPAVTDGTYLLQLTVTSKDGQAAVFDHAGNPVGYIVAGPLVIGTAPVSARKPTQPVDAAFADHIHLTGYDLERTASENTLLATLYWQATGNVSNDYTVFVHVLSPDGELIAQHDSPPLLPTSLWVAGNPVVDVHPVTLPADLPSTDYEIRVGLYHWPDLERVPIVDANGLDSSNDTLLLGTKQLDPVQTP